MHEFSLTTDLLKVSREEARKAGIIKLDRIFLRIGNLSGVCVDAIEFAFGFLREEEEMTRDAELVIERVPGKGRCTSCGRDVELEHWFLLCPECGTATVEITQGSEFLIVSLEGRSEAEPAEKAGEAGGSHG
jgi:hydrogenase nickel incorporation protein HypA/HybF